MRRAVLVLALLAAGCGQELTPEERELRDRQDVAQVEKANEVLPPLEPVTPEPLLYPDIERYDIKGAACNYAPGTSLGTRVVAREADAFIKIGGEVERLAADSGARELPLRTRSRYTGKAYELRLELKGEGASGEAGPADLEGTVTLRDGHGRVVYTGTGLAQCAG
ncbi:MAG: hypothetical protein B7Z08_07335 [Sphingomonadales bacterium 32-68-7]|nr:MAG: hypothetical protein B7Z33_03455 [Sphingomonadales bacterium 12-68-11]OYX08957.1 MAG: hypothetical protein B7Z08_07335 [Sphingomonadales bacterium 32-68-7]